MTSVLHSGSLGSLNAGMGDNLLHGSSLSVDSQGLLVQSDEDVTLTLKQNGPFSPTKTLDELSFLAISAQITEVTYSISDVQTRIFEIQELRHRSEANQSSASATAPSSSHGHTTETSTTNIDQALINLDDRLESISSSMATIDAMIAPLIASAKTPTTSKTVTETNYGEDAIGTLLRKHANMIQDWDSVQEEADTLKGELREDKWLAVFRTVGEQAEAMMVSLEKAVTHCQDFIWQVHRNRKALTDDGHSGISSGSMSGEKPINYEMFQSLQSSYDAKKRYYMPATTKVLAILDRSVRDRVTKNGECLRRHAEARARWKNLRERINRIDLEMETVRLFFVTKDKEQEPEPSEVGSAISRQTSRSNYTTKSNYLSTPSTKVSNLSSRSRTVSSAGTASAFSRSMSPLKRFASKVSASVRSGVSTGDGSRNGSSISVHSSQASRPDYSPSPSGLSGFSGSENGMPRPPPRSPFRPPGNKISAISSSGVEDESTTKEKKKRESSLFPFLSRPPPPSALGRSTTRAPSRSSLSGGDTSASGSSKPRWNGSTKVENAAPLPTLPPSQNATIRATPSRQSVVNQVFRPLSPEGPTQGRRSLSRSENRPPTSQGRHTPWNSVDFHGSTTPSRPASRTQSRAGARTPNGGLYGTAPRTRPITPSHIPSPVSYFNQRSPSRADSENDMDDEEMPTSLMQRAFTPSAARTPENPHRRRPSNSMIPVPRLNVTSGSRPGTSMSMARSSSPNSHDGGRTSPRESPSAWKNSPVVRDTSSTPHRESSSTRPGARSQTPESMLRARAMQMPGYVDAGSPGTSASPGTRPRAGGPSSFKGDGRTLVSGPGNGGSPGASGSTSTPGRPQSRTTSRLNSYGFGRMTPTLDAPGQVYVPAKTDELDVEVASVINGMAHGFLFERVDPPRKTPAKAGEEIKAQYAVSNALGRKLITCRLVTVTRAGTQSKKVMCRVGGGWLELQMYILNRQAGLS